MDSKGILRVIAPCGLNCGRCVAYKDGDIQKHAQALCDLLGDNFETYANAFTEMDPSFANYKPFRQLLDWLASASCGNCRTGGCLFNDCHVRVCVQDKGVDFCFQCTQFPCAEHNFNARLEKIWLTNNRLMASDGVEAFYESVKDRPRYP